MQKNSSKLPVSYKAVVAVKLLVKYDPKIAKEVRIIVPKDVVITEKGLHDAVDALVKACDDKIDEMLGDIDISREMEFIETGKWPENFDPNLAKEVRIIVPKDLPVTSDIIMKAHDLIMKEGDKKWENGIEVDH